MKPIACGSSATASDSAVLSSCLLAVATSASLPSTSDLKVSKVPDLSSRACTTIGPGVPPTSAQFSAWPENTRRSCSMLRRCTGLPGFTTTARPSSAMTCSLLGDDRSPSAWVAASSSFLTGREAMPTSAAPEARSVKAVAVPWACSCTSTRALPSALAARITRSSSRAPAWVVTSV